MLYKCSCGKTTDFGVRCANCSRDISLSSAEIDIDIEDLIEQEDEGDEDEENQDMVEQEDLPAEG